MANLIGTAPNQVPTNADLGSAAYINTEQLPVSDPQQATLVAKVTSTDNAIVRFDGTGGAVQNSTCFIDDSGNMGVGTSSPTSKLSVMDTNGGFFFDGRNTTYNRIKSHVAPAVGKSLLIATTDSGDSGLYLNTSGNLGIGTTSPSQKLHVAGTGYASSDFRAPIFYDSDNTSYYVDPASTSNLVGLTVTNTITGSISGNAATATTATNQSGGTVTATTGSFSGRVAINGSATETKVALSSGAINLSSGGYFTYTLSSATTFSLSNIPTSGNGISFILELTNAGSYTITWFSGIKWANGGVAPVLTTGIDSLGFYSHDGGTSWRGFVLGKNMA